MFNLLIFSLYVYSNNYLKITGLVFSLDWFVLMIWLYQLCTYSTVWRIRKIIYYYKQRLNTNRRRKVLFLLKFILSFIIYCFYLINVVQHLLFYLCII